MSDATTARSELLRAIMLMTASMAAFACGDALVNLLSERVSRAQIFMTFGIGSFVIFAGVALRRGESMSPGTLRHPAVLLRLFAEIVSAVGMITALSLAPLSTVVAIMQATPMFVTLGAALALKEPVGWRRWAAVIAGFIGVLVIINPFGTGFDPNSLWAVVGVLGMSVRDLTTRMVPRSMGAGTLAFYSTLGVFPLGLLLIPFTGAPALSGGTILLLALMASFGGLGYLLLTASLRLSEISAVSPFRYTRLIFAILIAIIFLGERPTPAVWIGSAIVVGSGLFILWRERRIGQAS